MGKHFRQDGRKGGGRGRGFRLSDLFLGGRHRRRADELERENATLRSQLTPEMADAAYAASRIRLLNDEALRLQGEIEAKVEKSAGLDAQIEEKRRKLVTFDDEILVQEFGLYEPRFDFANSSQYADRLKRVRERQKESVRQFNESLKKSRWKVNGSAAQGRKMASQVGRLLMRAYNGECDEVVRKVKYANVLRSTAAVEKLANSINKLGSVLDIRIPEKYVDLKLEEVQLAFEFAQQKEREKEELRAERERRREEAKLKKEIAEQRKKLEKERKQYSNAYNDVVTRIRDASGQERQDLELRAEELRSRVADVGAALRDIDYREANQKAGYVYVISNIGSFGEGVYKIGMTRRLDPMERIKELGDASVPFGFDVHAMIFCDDAPALEAALHKAFEDRKINLVNQRREFFRVSLEEVEEVVKRNYDKTVEFVEVPDAEQYRASVKMAEEAGGAESRS